MLLYGVYSHTNGDLLKLFFSVCYINSHFSPYQIKSYRNNYTMNALLFLACQKVNFSF